MGHLHWAPFVMDSLKNFHVPAEDQTGDLSILRRALYHVAIKAGLYRKAVQVYYLPNQYPLTLKKTEIKVTSSQILDPLILVQNLPFSLPVSCIIYNFCGQSLLA